MIKSEELSIREEELSIQKEDLQIQIARCREILEESQAILQHSKEISERDSELLSEARKIIYKNIQSIDRYATLTSVMFSLIKKQNKMIKISLMVFLFSALIEAGLLFMR